MTQEVQNPNDENLAAAAGRSAAGLDDGDAHWDRILADPKPRAELTRWVAEVEIEIASGQTRRLQIEDL
jgi:hypothetical protein